MKSLYFKNRGGFIAKLASLFNAVSEEIIFKAIDEIDEIKANRTVIDNARYADETLKNTYTFLSIRLWFKSKG